MEKTYSQKVAGVFEIVCYILLIPASISLVYPAIAVVGGLFKGRLDAVLIGLIPFGIAGIGVKLLSGYSRHAKGKLDEKHISTLWITTAVYNFLLLLPWLLLAAAVFQSREKLTDGKWASLLILISIIFGYLAAIYFSVKAYTLEKFIRI